MSNNEIIYLDNSIISTYRSCHEKARLKYQLDLQPIIGAPPLEFGGAFHAGIQGFYVEMSKNTLSLSDTDLKQFFVEQ